MYYMVNNASYWYEKVGQGEPLIFLHGFTGTGGTWADFMDSFCEKFTVITIDLPGHGKTVTKTPKTMEACCSDLASMFDYLKLGKVNLVGYSMGGRTALSFAMLYPEMVKSLTLESASPGLADEAARIERKKSDEQLAQRIERDGITAFVDFWENIPLFQTQKKLPADIRQEIRSERLSQSVQGLATSLRNMGTGSQPSWWDKLQQLNMPVCLIAGELDEKFVELNTMIKEKLPEAGFNIVKNAGHAIHVEQPGFFGRIVNGFVKELSL